MTFLYKKNGLEVFVIALTDIFRNFAAVFNALITEYKYDTKYPANYKEPLVH